MQLPLPGHPLWVLYEPLGVQELQFGGKDGGAGGGKSGGAKPGGKNGGATGVAELDEADGADETPYAVVAVTVNVYAVPLLRPVTTIGEEEPLAVAPPGLAVTVYVTVLFPAYAGAVNATDTSAFPAVTAPIVGASEYLPPLDVFPRICIFQ